MYNTGMNNMFCMIEDGIIYQVDTYNTVLKNGKRKFRYSGGVRPH